MPESTIRPARSSASARLSSSGHARSGPDSSQQVRQRAPQRLVSCQAKKRGARYSSTARPGIAGYESISSEADVRLGHDLLGDVLQLRRLPFLPLAGPHLLALHFLLLVLLALQVQFHVAHFASVRSNCGSDFGTVSRRQLLASACCNSSSTARRAAASTSSLSQARR